MGVLSVGVLSVGLLSYGGFVLWGFVRTLILRRSFLMMAESHSKISCLSSIFSCITYFYCHYRPPVIFITYIYPHDIWTRICIPGFFDHDSIAMTVYYMYFKGLSYIRLGFRYLWGYFNGFKIRKYTVASFPLSNFQTAYLNVWWLIPSNVFYA